MRTRLIGLLWVSLFASLFTSLFTNPAKAAEFQDSGTLSFPTSGSAEAQAHFLRGVSILHSFGWKQAISEFQTAQNLDADFAMAYWGEALCYNHPLFGEQDRQTPQNILLRLADTPAERQQKAPTDREKGFLLAVESLFFGPENGDARRQAYMQNMRKLHQRYPDDDEVGAFYALSLLSSQGADAPTRHRMNVAAGTIALQLLQKNPKHPGAAHYTIHAFDDPVHATLALPAARVFADIAPAVSHARHMPTHIFIQHGMWDEVSSSNQSAYDAAVALWEPGDSAGDMTHALDWGQYGDLQRGDYQRAQLWIERMQKVSADNPDQLRVQAALPRVKARLILETRNWQTQPITETTADTELLAIGISGVQLGDLDTARQAASKLHEMAQRHKKNLAPASYARNGKPVLVMYHELAGTIAIAAGEQNKGLKHLATAVKLAESMRPPNGAPNPIKPAHELYAEQLLALGQAEAATRQFQTSLLRTPNRPLSLLGLARAHTAAGDANQAAQAYRKLSQVWRARKFPELKEAQLFLTSLQE